MPSLQRFTTQYVDSEDRVRLTGALSEGVVLSLWLTRRLLDRLIPHLTLWLERQHANLPRPELVLEFAQQEALSQLVPQPPVEAGDAQVHLVISIDISPANEQICLCFKTGAGAQADISFAATPLRQWLGILRHAYQQADWPLFPWPEWMVADERAGQNDANAHPLLH